MADDQRRPRASRRHRADIVSLVAGLIFLGIALGWLLLTVGAIQAEAIAWIGPGLLITVGLVGVLASRRR